MAVDSLSGMRWMGRAPNEVRLTERPVRPRRVGRAACGPDPGFCLGFGEGVVAFRLDSGGQAAGAQLFQGF